MIRFVVEVMMKLSQDEVAHVAKLARLELTEEEKEKYSHELSEVLNYVAQLNEVETKNVPITARVSESVNVFREDEPEKGEISREEFLHGVTDSKDGMVRVKAVLE